MTKLYCMKVTRCALCPASICDCFMCQCGLTQKDISIAEGTLIPEWCPLEDVKLHLSDPNLTPEQLKDLREEADRII